MIVKVVLHKNLDAFSVWNKDGDRLYYSDKPADIDVAKKLLLVIRKKTDGEVAEEVMGKKFPEDYFNEQRMHGYFNAYWKNKIVQITKRAAGYSW